MSAGGFNYWKRIGENRRKSAKICYNRVFSLLIKFCVLLSQPRMHSRSRMIVHFKLFLLSFCSTIVLGNVHGPAFCAALLGGSAPTSAISPFELDFSTLLDDVRSELTDLGFSFEKGMEDDEAIRLFVKNDRLNIATPVQSVGVMVKKDLHVLRPGWLEIEWGIEQYPHGGAWHLGRKQEAVMVVLFFGDSLSSTSFYLPDVPVFLGMFLGEHEPPLQPFVSENYGDRGRYVCVGNPRPGQTITTRLNIPEAFHYWIGNRAMPSITGIAIEVDTSDLPAGATSSAFIKRISLKEAD